MERAEKVTHSALYGFGVEVVSPKALKGITERAVNFPVAEKRMKPPSKGVRTRRGK